MWWMLYQCALQLNRCSAPTALQAVQSTLPEALPILTKYDKYYHMALMCMASTPLEAWQSGNCTTWCERQPADSLSVTTQCQAGPGVVVMLMN